MVTKSFDGATVSFTINKNIIHLYIQATRVISMGSGVSNINYDLGIPWLSTLSEDIVFTASNYSGGDNIGKRYFNIEISKGIIRMQTTTSFESASATFRISATLMLI